MGEYGLKWKDENNNKQFPTLLKIMDGIQEWHFKLMENKIKDQKQNKRLYFVNTIKILTLLHLFLFRLTSTWAPSPLTSPTWRQGLHCIVKAKLFSFFCSLVTLPNQNIWKTSQLGKFLLREGGWKTSNCCQRMSIGRTGSFNAAFTNASDTNGKEYNPLGRRRYNMRGILFLLYYLHPESGISACTCQS